MLSFSVCTLSFGLVACGGLQGIGVDAAPESPNDLPPEAPAESQRDAPLEAPSAELSGDQKADAIDWNGSVDCNDMICGSGEACISYVGGADGGPLDRRCVTALDACGAGLECNCIAQHFGCGGGCTQVTARQFACGEGNGGNPDQFKVCPVPRNVGCFTGEICGSPQTDPMCVQGAWQCPSSSHATESCPPDSGTGDASDSGG
jgi:hypothetical protein